jgi:hypothetical protein
MGPLYSTNPHAYDSSGVLVALRELLAQDWEAASYGAEELTDLLYGGHFLSYRPAVFEVEAALAALLVEGEVLP